MEQQASTPSPRRPWIVLALSLVALAPAFWLLNSMRAWPGAAAELAAAGKVLFLIYVPLLLIRSLRERPEDYGLRLDHWRLDLKFALLLAAAVLPLYMLGHVLWFGVIKGHIVTAHLDWRLLRGAALMILVIGIPEEAFFRGWVQTLLSRRWGESGPRLLGVHMGPDVWLSALIFAAAHVAIRFDPALAATFFPGLAFAWLRKRTGSVLGAGLFHGLCNTAVLVFKPNLFG